MRFMWQEGLKGLAVGVVVGGLAGLGVCMWLVTGTLLFPGDTMLFGAVVCGVLGFFMGETFFVWLREHWHTLVG